jgi:hypothetical protein
VMTSSLPLRSLGSAASLLAATRYQGNHERKHNLLKILWCQVLRDIVPSFPFLFLAESVKILLRLRTGFPSAEKRSPKVILIGAYIVVHTEFMFDMCFHKIKENEWTFYFKTR